MEDALTCLRWLVKRPREEGVKGGGGEGGCRGKGPEGDSREESDPGAGRGCGRAGHLRPGMLGALGH